MDLPFPAIHKIAALLDKGVTIRSPYSVDIGDDVDIERIADDVVIHAGCRIHGPATSIGPGSEIGREGPATIEDCQLGAKVELKSGYFRKATFLDHSNMGLGAQVREGCLLEEEASAAHCVGIKQTILFPFVVLGSLINFCDCLMAGGTSRKDHSEVGSSYIHFNFTPDQDKTTASLIGDVPRGVMLNQPPIFLGGQGGMVGPLRIGYGTLAAAGSILRREVTDDGKLIVESMPRSMQRDHAGYLYPTLGRMVHNNLIYVGNLIALQQWYRHARRPFFSNAFGEAVYEGAVEKIGLGRKERVKRLDKLAGKMALSLERCGGGDRQADRKKELLSNKDVLLAALAEDPADTVGEADRDALLAALETARGDTDGYTAAIRSLPKEAAAAGSRWLQAIVDDSVERAWTAVPAFRR